MKDAPSGWVVEIARKRYAVRIENPQDALMAALVQLDANGAGLREPLTLEQIKEMELRLGEVRAMADE